MSGPREEVTPSGTSRAVLVVCLATGFATLLDSAILTVAAPALRDELGASTGQLQWILAGYSLTFGLALVPAGRLGDVVGRRGLLAVGLAVFAAASLVGATAQDADVLVLARLLQGVGAGIANPQVIGLLQDHFVGPARARALGAYASTGAFAAVIAPLIGGGILSGVGPEAGWRLVVGLAAPLGTAVAVLCLRLVPRGVVRGGSAGLRDSGGLVASRGRGSRGLDLVGLALIAVATLGLLVPFVVQGGGAAERTPWVGALVVAVVLLVWWERRYARQGRTPVLSPELVRSRSYVLGCLVATFTFGAVLGYQAVLMLFLQDGAGLSPVQAGLVTTPGALASVIAANLSWRLLRRFGRRTVTLAVGGQLVVALLTLTVVLTAPAAVIVGVIVVAQVLSGVATGLSISPNQALTLEGAPAGQHGVAAGALQLSQRVAATVCIAGMTGAFVAASAGAASGAVEDYRGALVVVTVVTAALALAACAVSLVDEAGRGRNA